MALAGIDQTGEVSGPESGAWLHSGIRGAVTTWRVQRLPQWVAGCSLVVGCLSAVCVASLVELRNLRENNLEPLVARC
jgi:hypothetical protein